MKIFHLPVEHIITPALAEKSTTSTNIIKSIECAGITVWEITSPTQVHKRVLKKFATNAQQTHLTTTICDAEVNPWDQQVYRYLELTLNEQKGFIKVSAKKWKVLMEFISAH